MARNNKGLCRNYESTFNSTEEMIKIAATRLILENIQTGSKCKKYAVRD